MQKISYPSIMLTPIKQMLHAGLLRNAGLARHVATAEIIECAQACLESLLPGVEGARVHSLRDGVLTIVTESALMAHEIHFRAARLILAVNAAMGEGAVVRVRYRVEKKNDEV